MVRYDLIVVGAGPGGSNAARVALEGGLAVAQIDACRFPRVKPCAGGVTLKARRALAFDLGPLLRGSFHQIEFGAWGKRVNRFSSPDPVLLMVCRPEFDNHLVQQNRTFDRFDFFDGEPVRHVAYDGVFRVRTSRQQIAAPQLVGADGAYSLVNRTFGVSRPRGVATAVEVGVGRSRLASSDALIPSLDYGAVPQGYGWIFPKDDHLSIGLYTTARHTRDMRTRLVEYMASRGILPAGDPLDGFEAHRFPVGGFRLRTPSAPVYIVGDAGGFGDAVTGEGIYHALESGRLAGVTACEVAAGKRSHHAYYRRLWRSVLPDTALAYAISTELYRNTDKGIRILEHPLVWRPLIEGYSQGSTLTRCLVRGGLYLARSLAKQSACQKRGWDEARLPREFDTRRREV